MPLREKRVFEHELQYPKSMVMRNNFSPSPLEFHNDGKVFFKNVKARLSEEKFNEFLLNIKRLNGKVQSKQQTLINVAALFGSENEDLLRSF